MATKEKRENMKRKLSKYNEFKGELRNKRNKKERTAFKTNQNNKKLTEMS